MTTEEAIKIIRNIHQTDAEKEALQTLIPELKENEDERIGKELIRLLSIMTDSIIENYTPIPLRDFITHLEKQKEQKPVEWSNSVAKEMFIKALERAVEQTKKGYELTDCDKHSWWEEFKSYSKIKFAEWSEEDERMLSRCVKSIETSKQFSDISDTFKQAKDKEISWLKSLPERFNLQPKQEWSEEDDVILVDIFWAIRHCAYDDKRKKRVHDWFVNRIKSLRPQPKDKTYKEKDEAFKLGKHHLAIKFINYLDKNRPEGKMSLSNSECEDIDKAFKENDWAKILRYARKYEK